MHLGEIDAGQILDFKFSSRSTTGAPTTLAGTPAVSVYKGNGTTESTSGVTLTVDFDARTGLNHVRIDTSADGTFYATGSDFQVVITAGTVGGTSVVGEVVGHFNIRNRAGLKPTTIQRTLDVSAAGEAGIDWANIGSAGSTQNLSATTVGVVTDLADNAINAATLAADTITAAKIADGAIDRATFAADTGLQSIRSNTAQAGAAGSITLDASASATNEFYKGAWILLTGGTGAGQVRLCITYNGTTKVASILPNWTTNPDVTSTFAILPAAGVDLELWANTLPNVLIAGRVDANAQVVGTGAIAAASFAAGAIDAAAIANGAIDAAAFAANAIDSVAIADNAITAAKLATGAITAAKFAAGAIDAAAIANGAIDALTFAAGAVDAAALAADAVAEIAAAILITPANKLSTDTNGSPVARAVDSGLVLSTTAQAGSTATTIVLNTGASATDDIFTGYIIRILQGTGNFQTRVITDYDGTTKVATVNRPWVTTPDSTSVFAIYASDQIVDALIHSGTAQAGAAGSITLDTGASSSDDFYNNTILSITAGTGRGQSRIISDYTGATRVATVNGNWITTPDSTSVFVILPFGSVPGASAPTAAQVADAVWDELLSDHLAAGSFGRASQVLRDGTAQGGAAGSITLDAGASASDDFYNNTILQITSGTGAGQSRIISDYTGSSKVATVNGNWIINPDATSVFVIRAFGSVPGASAPTAADVADAVWDEARSGHTTAGSFGQGAASVQGNVTGSVASVTGAVGSIASGGIAAASFAAGAIDAAAIATGAITAAKFGAGAIDAAAIADGAIDAATFAAGAINAAAIAADAITAAKIATGAITAAKFAAGAIDAAAIATGAVDADALAADAVAEIADGVWDEQASGHVASGSFGQAQNLIRAGTAQAGAASTITLDAGASASDDFYNNAIVFVTGGTGAGQSRIISDYVGSTKVATVNGNWITNPDATSVFVILPFGAIPGASAPTAADVADAVWDEARSGHTTAGTFGREAQTLRDGTAQAGAAGTITLDTGASASDDFYNNTILEIAAGTGVGQSRIISDYTGATKVATVNGNWITTPDSTSVFVIRAFGAVPGASAPTAGDVADAVWDEARAGHTTAGTFGQGVASVQGNVTGSAASVTGSVGSVASGGIAAASFAAGAIDAAAIAAGAITAAKFAAGAIDAAAIATGAITAAKFAAGAIDAAAIATGAVDADALATDAVNEIADGLLDRNMATGTDSGSSTVRTVRQALRLLRNRWTSLAGTLTAYKEDDSTVSWSSTLSSDASAAPITGSDPAS